MTRRGAGAATVAAAIAIGAGGCGGDDGPSSGEFVSQANTVCKRHYQKISAAAGKLLAGGKLPSPREFGMLAQGTIIPEYTAQIRELREVEPAEDKANAYRAWLDASEKLRSSLQANPALIQNPRQLAAVNRQADELGLSRECHVGPGG
ncbi:MAG: hypothetical protein AVDCRST_MAG67-836 [uncultured Solirubrobacteraceae bacterium]|uniref:Lipoprotein n=1 Tax=uncultured Solirubrobacteraceae bacterium TaxID=1162706 RepID=A0A6J4RW43_9ACTN|nr:MAG: hypothetical protein AVDCRST_MAG67-836 [uncultured Solirubrobacteraceae bacterium]